MEKTPISILRLFYIKGGQTSRTKSRVGKKIETEDRTDWKSNVKKIITTADVLFSAQNQIKSKEKKGHQVRKCPIFHSVSVGNKVKFL